MKLERSLAVGNQRVLDQVAVGEPDVEQRAVPHRGLLDVVLEGANRLSHGGESTPTPWSRVKAKSPPDLLEALAQLGLKAAVGRPVEASALDVRRKQPLVGDALGLVVRVDVALAAAQRAGARVVGV